MKDTVYILIGRIGKENLSIQGQKRLKKLNELNDGLVYLEKAFNEAEDADKATYEQKVTAAQEYLTDYEADFLSFLQDEENDLKARAEKQAQAEAAKKEKQAEEARKKAEAEATQRAKAAEDAEKAAEAEAAKKAAEAEAARKKAEAEAAANPNGTPPPTDTPAKKSNSTGYIIGGILLTVATFGAYSFWKNQR